MDKVIQKKNKIQKKKKETNNPKKNRRDEEEEKVKLMTENIIVQIVKNVIYQGPP
jgi:hypothetical protein